MYSLTHPLTYTHYSLACVQELSLVAVGAGVSELLQHVLEKVPGLAAFMRERKRKQREDDKKKQKKGAKGATAGEGQGGGKGGPREQQGGQGGRFGGGWGGRGVI
jgi:hypothetical protein